MQEYQKRVVQEYEEVWDRYFKLGKFLNDATQGMLEQIGAEEAARLQRQFRIMDEYAQVLRERIENFNP